MVEPARGHDYAADENNDRDNNNADDDDAAWLKAYKKHKDKQDWFKRFVDDFTAGGRRTGGKSLGFLNWSWYDAPSCWHSYTVFPRDITDTSIREWVIPQQPWYEKTDKQPAPRPVLKRFDRRQPRLQPPRPKQKMQRNMVKQW